MAQIRRDTHNPVAFKRIMRLGRVAYAEGDYRQAHELWQQAALMQPDNEDVWTALLQVLDNDDDRRVCLRNILTINPHNERARQMLDELIGDTQPPDVDIVPDVSPVASRRRFSPGYVALRVLQSAVIGGLIAVGMLVVRYMLF